MSRSSGKILLVRNRMASVGLLVAKLRKNDNSVQVADAETGWLSFLERRFDLVIIDDGIPRGGGIALLRRIRRAASEKSRIPVVLFSASATLSTATAAGRAGATDFYPFNDTGIEQLVRRVRQMVTGPSPLPAPLLGGGPKISDVRRKLRALSAADVPVLLTGERGSGRASAARFLYELGPRRSDPFVRVLCGSRGAARPILGVVFWEDVDRLSHALQAELADRMESENLELPSSGRVVASTERDLMVLAEDGLFHRGLAERLSRFTIPMPPLRQRPEDLEPLIHVLLSEASQRLFREAPRLTSSGLERLQRHPWNENVKELECVLELATAFSEGHDIDAEGIERVFGHLQGPLDRVAQERSREERDTLLRLFRKHGTFSGVARELGITRNAAKYRFIKYGLHPRRPPPNHHRAPSPVT